MPRLHEHPVDLLNPCLLKLNFFLQLLTNVKELELSAEEVSGFWFWLADFHEDLQGVMTAIEKKDNPAS